MCEGALLEFCVVKRTDVAEEVAGETAACNTKWIPLHPRGGRS